MKLDDFLVPPNQGVQGDAQAASLVQAFVRHLHDVKEHIESHPCSICDTMEAGLLAMGPSVIDPLLAAASRRKTRHASLIRLLGQFGDPRPYDLLVSLLADRKEDPSLRTAAAVSLDSLSDPRAIAPLIAMVNDAHEDHDVRLEAVTTLASFTDLRATTGLIALLQNATQPIWLRQQVAFYLGTMKEERAKDALVSVLADDNSLLTLRAAYALAELHDSRAYEPLLSYLSVPHDSLRQAAIEALGILGDSRALPLLREVYARDTSSTVRRAAEEAIIHLQSH
jgi:HEAT repeat protein